MAREISYDNEGDVKKQIKKILNAHEWFWWMPAGSAFGTTGVSDFTGLKQGVFLAIEAKFGKNKPTAMQIAYINSIRAEGGFGFYVNEKRVDALRDWAAAYDRAVIAASRNEKPTPEDGAMMLNTMQLLMAEP